MDELQQELFKLQDLKYRNFHSKLMPGIDKETIIGIRTPVLRKFAKEFAKTEAAEAFLQELPHTYYEENNLHMQLISDIKDYERCLAEVKRFLPYINNWATCDISEEYYVNMMIAWYLATALAKQWDATIPYLEERKLSPWVHRKTIQKAVESYRITDEQKVYLKTLRENC